MSYAENHENDFASDNNEEEMRISSDQQKLIVDMNPRDQPQIETDSQDSHSYYEEDSAVRKHSTISASSDGQGDEKHQTSYANKQMAHTPQESIKEKLLKVHEEPPQLPKDDSLERSQQEKSKSCVNSEHDDRDHPQKTLGEVQVGQMMSEEEIEALNPISMLKNPDKFRSVFQLILSNGLDFYRKKDIEKGLLSFNKALDMLELGKNILSHESISPFAKIVTFANLAYGYQVLRKLQKCNRFCERIKQELERLIMEVQNCSVVPYPIEKYLKLAKLLITIRFQHCAIVSQLEQHEKALEMCRGTIPSLRKQIEIMLKYLNENSASRLLQKKSGETVQFSRHVQKFAENLLLSLLGFLDKPLKESHFYFWQKNPEQNEEQIRRKFIPSSGLASLNFSKGSLNGNYSGSLLSHYVPECKRSILGVTKSSHWIDEFNIGSIMHLSMLTVEDFTSNEPMEEYFFKDKLYEWVILCSLGYFMMATEIRHVDPGVDQESLQAQQQSKEVPTNFQVESSNTGDPSVNDERPSGNEGAEPSQVSEANSSKSVKQNTHLSKMIFKKYGYQERTELHKLSELYHLRSIEIISKTIQTSIPYLLHIIKSFERHYLKKKELDPIRAILDESLASEMCESKRNDRSPHKDMNNQDYRFGQTLNRVQGGNIFSKIQEADAPNKQDVLLQRALGSGSNETVDNDCYRGKDLTQTIQLSHSRQLLLESQDKNQDSSSRRHESEKEGLPPQSLNEVKNILNFNRVVSHEEQSNEQQAGSTSSIPIDDVITTVEIKAQEQIGSHEYLESKKYISDDPSPKKAKKFTLGVKSPFKKCKQGTAKPISQMPTFEVKKNRFQTEVTPTTKRSKSKSSSKIRLMKSRQKKSRQITQQSEKYSQKKQPKDSKNWEKQAICQTARNIYTHRSPINGKQQLITNKSPGSGKAKKFTLNEKTQSHSKSKSQSRTKFKRSKDKTTENAKNNSKKHSLYTDPLLFKKSQNKNHSKESRNTPKKRVGPNNSSRKHIISEKDIRIKKHIIDDEPMPKKGVSESHMSPENHQGYAQKKGIPESKESSQKFYYAPPQPNEEMFKAFEDGQKEYRIKQQTTTHIKVLYKKNRNSEESNTKK